MVRGIDRPEREQYMLVTLKYGDVAVRPTPDRYTDWDRAVGEFLPIPTMEIKLPPNVGTFEQREGRILLPSTETLPAVLADHLHSNWPVNVTIQEINLGLFAGDEALARVVFKGRAIRSVANHQGREGTTAIFFLSEKSRLAQVKLGLPCNHHCVWRMFGPGCEMVQASHDETGVIASISGAEVTLTTPNTPITAPVAPGGTNTRIWERGYLQYDNLRIPIKRWDTTAPTLFYLRRRPPASWVGPSITFVPGCHKTIEDCRTTWNNEGGNGDSQAKGGFGGAGYAIPPHNPLYESPESPC